jgi:hypothetical protein
LLAKALIPELELTCTESVLTPGAAPSTFTDTAQDAMEPIAPADRLNVPEPAAAVTVPPQVLATFGVDAITKPAGKLSVNATPVIELMFGLLIVTERSVVPFNGMVAAPNALVTIGGESTVKLALAVLPVPPLAELTGAVVFV